MKVLEFISISGLLLVGSNETTLAQKIQGVYFGELISEKNTLVISSSGSVLTGACYLNKTDKLNFSGTYDDKLLKGTIKLNDGTDVALEGHIEDGTLKLNYSIHDEQKSTSLVKFSSKDRYDADDVYSDSHDPVLVGKWHYVEHTDVNGVTAAPDSKIVIEYLPNGIETMQMITVSAKVMAKSPPGFNPHKKVEFTWLTDGTTLSSSIRVPQGNIPSGTVSYFVKKDTLFVSGAKGWINVYVRGDY